MYGKEHYYCRFRDTNQDEHILQDVYINMCGLDDDVKTYEVVSKKIEKTSKKKILSVYYTYLIRNLHHVPCILIWESIKIH